MSLGPDFVCIGAPKSGTTWLYRNLNTHPSIWIPAVKELHYFDALFPLAEADPIEARPIKAFCPRNDASEINTQTTPSPAKTR